MSTSSEVRLYVNKEHTHTFTGESAGAYVRARTVAVRLLEPGMNIEITKVTEELICDNEYLEQLKAVNST